MNPFGSTLSRPRVPSALRTRCISTKANVNDRQAAVAQKLLHLEGELAFITQPGRIPPRAAVVAGIRKEISALRSELTNPGTLNDLDLTVPPTSASSGSPASRAEAAPPAAQAPAPLVQSAGSKAASRQTSNASGARSALLAIEKKLGSQSTAAPLSEKAKSALEAIEGNMSSVVDASKNLNEFEALQVENALLRTQLEVIMERKRHLSQLTLAVRRGLIPVESKKKKGRPVNSGQEPNRRATQHALGNQGKESKGLAGATVN